MAALRSGLWRSGVSRSGRTVLLDVDVRHPRLLQPAVEHLLLLGVQVALGLFAQDLQKADVVLSHVEVGFELTGDRVHDLAAGHHGLVPEGLDQHIARLCKRIYKALCLSGYARMDLRLAPDGQVYLLEANPNPEVAYGEDLAESAETAQISYEKLMGKILSLGFRYRLRGQA